MAQQHGADIKAYTAADEHLHDLQDRLRRLPGGGATEVAGVQTLRLQAALAEGRVDDCRSPRVRRELEAFVERQRADLKQREDGLAALPAEAKVEPLVLVRQAEQALAAARAAGADAEKLRERVRELADLRKKAEAVIEQRRRLQEQVNEAVLAGKAAAAAALSSCFKRIKTDVAALCGPVEVELPETLDVAKLEALWKEGKAVADAAQLVSAPIVQGDLLDAVPAVLSDVVAQAFGYGALRPIGIGGWRATG